jgi:hypothetical protein
VQVRGPDGRRLNPRRKDLQRWRERFAEQLREHGVEANATPRRARGETQRYPKPAVVHMIARGEVPRYWKPMPADAQRDAGWVAHGGVFAAWREMAYAMARSRAREDRAMAVEMAYFVGGMPVQRDRPVTERSQSTQREPVQTTLRGTGEGLRDVEPDVDR